MKTLLHNSKFEIVLQRLCHELIESHLDFSNTVLIGVQPRGTLLADNIVEILTHKNKIKNIQYGKLDITFYRDDFNTSEELHMPEDSTINFSIENKKVVLIDDVLFTGRTIRSAMDAILDYGRPQKVELLVLIDRRFERQLPIQPNYVGVSIDATANQKVKLKWEKGNKEVYIIKSDNKA